MGGARVVSCLAECTVSGCTWDLGLLYTLDPDVPWTGACQRPRYIHGAREYPSPGCARDSVVRSRTLVGNPAAGGLEAGISQGKVKRAEIDLHHLGNQLGVAATLAQ